MNWLFLFCSLFALAQGKFDEGHKALCALDVTRGASDLMDAGLDLWAASKRSDQTTSRAKEELSVDITAVIGSVSKVVEHILQAMTDCTALEDLSSEQTGAYQCGQAATKLTAGASELASAGAKLSMTCKSRRLVDVKKTSQGKCVVNVKDAMMELAEASALLTTAPQKCKTDGSKMEDCAEMALRVTSHLAALGKFIMGATKNCGSQTGIDVACAGAVSTLIQALSTVGAAGMEIDKECSTAANRLFSDGPTHIEVPNTFLPPFSVVLVAFVPIISVASFLGGRRFQKQQSERAFTLMEPELVSFE